MMMLVPIAIIIIRIAAEIAKAEKNERNRHAKYGYKASRKRVWKFKLFKTKLSYANNLFNGHFVDVKAFYAARFNRVACVSFIGELDISRAYEVVRDYCGDDIIDTYQHSYFNHETQEVYFNNTIIVLTSNRMIEIAGNYCQLLHTPNDYNWARWIMKELAVFKADTPQPQAPAYTQVLGFAGGRESLN